MELDKAGSGVGKLHCTPDDRIDYGADEEIPMKLQQREREKERGNKIESSAKFSKDPAFDP